MPIKRYFSPDVLKRIKKDFQFLIKFINNSYGEFDFSIRDNYFNIYYKGNSLAKVKPIKGNTYRITIHRKFFNGSKADEQKYFISINDEKKVYRIVILSPKQLHPFLQKTHLTEFASRIKKVNNGEEIDFEQSLITDNMDREDLIFIDRQITDTALIRKRLDLLALKQIEENKYQFLISEVKLGNNTELKSKVASQLEYYVEHVKTCFTEYKECYETNFKQKKELGLIREPKIYNIEIIEPVEGVIIVGGYSKIAELYIIELNKKYPHLKVMPLTNKLNFFKNEL